MEGACLTLLCLWNCFVSFGVAEFVNSKFLKSNVLKCPSVTNDGKSDLFTHMKNSKNGEKSYYACSGCRKITRRGTVSRVSVLWENKDLQLGTVEANPDLNHISGCVPLSLEQILGKELEKEVFVTVRNGKRPCDGYHSTLSSITKRCRQENANETGVIMNFRNKFELSRALLRHQEFGIPRINDPHNLPDIYHQTHRSKHSGGPPERWLLYENYATGTVMFASDHDLSILSRSPIWFADGTFKMCPKEFAQLYCVHVEYKGEPMPVMYCFL